MFKLIKYLLVLSLLFFGLGHIYYHQTGDFREGNILREAPGDFVSNTKGLGNILDQPFTFLAHGNQTFAFLSEDRKYVLKLFKKETLKRGYILPPVWPVKQFLIRKGKLNEQKMRRAFIGYQLAFEKDRENSGLISVHLSSVNQELPVITVVDRLGLSHQIDLNGVIFAVQKKGKTTRSVISELLDRGETKEVKEKIKALLALYQSEYEQGIIDQDHNVIDNTGFVGDQPIRIDLGKVTFDENFKNPEVYQKDLEKVKNRLKAWQEKYYPDYTLE